MTCADVDGVQSLTVELGGLEKDYPGLPFVIRSGDKWMKDKGRDFFISLEPSTLKPEKVCATLMRTARGEWHVLRTAWPQQGATARPSQPWARHSGSLHFHQCTGHQHGVTILTAI